MSKIKINSVTNANIYQDGVNFLGRASEVTLPSLKWKLATHTALGMVGEIKIPAGGLEAMESKIKWASYYPEAMLAGMDPRRGVQLQVRASLETYSALGLLEEVSLVFTLGGLYVEQGMGTMKAQESSQPEGTMTVYYYKLEIDKQLMMEVDVMANIYRAGEQDILARYRNLIGA